MEAWHKQRRNMAKPKLEIHYSAYADKCNTNIIFKTHIKT
jgi:hypothetical protein